MDPTKMHLVIDISNGCRAAYRDGSYINCARVDPALAQRIVDATTPFIARRVMQELLIKNGNQPTWVNHSMTSTINKVLRSCGSKGRNFRLGRSGVYARVWEVSVNTPLDAEDSIGMPLLVGLS